jgi:hypothetical protein
MKSRIEKLARKCGLIGHIWHHRQFHEEKISEREIAFANAILELAAKECDKESKRLAEIGFHNEAFICDGRVEAIRKLKL